MEKNTIGILKDKNALLVFLSQLISTVCDKMMSIGLVWYLTTQYSINIVPWFLTISFLPHVFMSFYSSGILSKVGVLRTVIQSEFIRGIILLVFFASLYFIPEKSQTFLVLLFASCFLVGIASSLFNPAVLSLPPRIVSDENVPALNALLDTSFSLSNILGAACSIFLLNIFDIKILVLINALSFIFAGILQSLVAEKKNNEIEVGDDQKIGPRTVLKKYPLIKRMLISFLFINVVFTPILVMIPWYVENIYKGSGSDLAIIEGAMGVGAFLVGIILSLNALRVKDDKRVKAIAIICFLFGLFFLLFSFSLSTTMASIILFFIGMLSTFLNVQVLTFFQMSLSSEEVPAIMVAVNIISTASMPLSFAISGLLFPIVNIPKFAMWCGILTMVIAIIMPRFLNRESQ